jgi:hypothetical protein
MPKPSTGDFIALASVIVGAGGILATLATVPDIPDNPRADAALGTIVIATGVVAFAALRGRGKPDAKSGHGKHPSINSRAGPDDETRDLAESEEAGQVPGNGHGNPRAPAPTGQPGQGLPPMTAGGSAPWIRPDIDASLPLIEECLELRLDGADLHSQRVTGGEPGDEVHVPLPSLEMVEGYRQALRKATGCGGPPDEGAVALARKLSASLQETLLQAVPELARRRLAEAGARRARQLAAIELRLRHSQLERYPWELIADPGALPTSTAGITVWRGVCPPLRAVYRGWTGKLLLTGTAVPLRLAPSGHDELAWIKSELAGRGDLKVRLSPGIPASFGSLMAEYRPAAFHLVAQETGPGPPPGNGGGPALAGPDGLPRLTVPELTAVGTWLGVLNWRDSATVPPGGSRPPGYQIADEAGTAVIGMAGSVPPYPGGLFATALYRCLAAGFSVLHAYFEAVCRVRHHDPHSTMWSVPVMYADTSNVVPFPVSDEARIRLSLAHFRLHADALDSELEALARENIQSAGEWAERTATPSVRTTCVTEYLAVAVAGQAGPAGGRHRQYVAKAQDDLEKALFATRTTLDLLGGSTPGMPAHRQARRDLYVLRTRYQTILRTLDELIGDMG